MVMTHFQALYQHGLACHQQGNLDTAREKYQAVLSQHPQHFDALHMMGILEAQSGQAGNAMHWFEQAQQINPKHPALFNNMGNVLKDAGQLQEALSHYDQAIRLKSNYEQAYNNRGVVWFQLHDEKQAIANFNRAIRINPNFSEPYNNLGNVYFEQGKFTEAIEAYGRALRLNPLFLDAIQNRGNAHKAAGHKQEAKADYEKAIQLNPNLAEPYANLASVLYDLKQLPEVIAYCNKALAIDPFLVEAHYNKALTEKDLGQWHDAIQSFDRVIELQPEYREAKRNKGMTLLLVERFEEGWEFYDFRLKAESKYQNTQSGFKPYVFDLASEKDKSILVVHEQGVGDQVLFGGLLNEFFHTVPKATVMVEKRLLPLYERSFPGKTFVAHDTPFDDIDYEACLLVGDLCKHFRKSKSDFQHTRTPYLIHDVEKAAQLRQAIKKDNAQFLCGIAWKSKNSKIGENKSLGLHDLRPLLEIPGIQFVNLQYGEVDQEIAAFQHETGIEITQYTPVDNYHDLDGHAALMGACDFMVAVSNTSMHLAGAIGKEAYLLCSNGPGAMWYWSPQANGRSLWYPSIAIHQQTMEGNWQPALSDVQVVLKRKSHDQ